MAELLIYDEIGEFGISAGDFSRELGAVTGDVTVRISSPGGDARAGLAIYNQLTHHVGTVSVVVDSLAASIASVIAMAAAPGRLLMARGAELMVHSPYALVVGGEDELRQAADGCARMAGTIASIYAGRTGRPVSVWRNAMRAETWFTASEAVEAGLADSADVGAAAGWDVEIAAALRSAFFPALSTLPG